MTSKSALQTWQDRLEFLNRERAIAASPDIKFQLDAQIAECEQKIRELSEKIVNDSSTENSSASERENPVQTRKNMAVNPPVDFVVITALEEERKAFLKQLPQSRKLPPTDGDIRVYHHAELPVEIDGTQGNYDLIILSLLNMGRVEATTATSDAIRRWEPRFVLLVGIAGGIESEDIGLGDILISDQIVDYELQKIREEGNSVRYQVHRAAPRLLGAAQNFDIEDCLKLLSTQPPIEKEPRRFVGAIASGDKVIAFDEVIQEYQKDWPKLIGVEMEAAGVATASFQAANTPGFFMVRGVSDLADQKKDSTEVKAWRNYACDIAAVYTIALLQSGPVPFVKKNLTSPSNLPYSGTPYFSGREDELETLQDQLQQNNQLAICAVSGMGGIGKTELAIQYALRNREEYSGGLCWLDCRSGDLGTQIVLYARSLLKLTIPEDLELPEQVKYCWQNWPTGKVLLVYDDVGDYKSVDTYLPPRTEARFKVLLTSRQKLLAEINRLDLDVLSPETALKLLQALVKDGRIEAQEEQAKALCAWLGYLPLAIELVGSYLQLDPLLSVTEAQEQLKESSLNAPLLEDQGFSGSVAQKGVAAAFELSWEKLSPIAQEMGCRLSLFAPAPIDWSWAEQCYPTHEIYDIAEIIDIKQDADRKEEYQEFKTSVHQYLNDINEQEVSLREVDQEIEKWIKQWNRDSQNREKTRNVELFGRNLIQVSQDDKKYRLHPLIREFFILKLQESLENIDDWKRDLCRVMVVIAKQIPSTVTLEVIKSKTAYIPHLREVGENLMEWVEDKDLTQPFTVLGRIYKDQSRFTEAEKWFKQSVEVISDRLGERHPDVASSYNNLAVLYLSMGRYEEALPLLQKALEIKLEQLGERHPDVATSYNNLALLY